MGEWQDISTAPKDWSAVIVYTGDHVGEAYYRNADDSDDGWWWAQTDWSDNGAEKINPTHWMSLPAPPPYTYQSTEPEDRDDSLLAK